jgi:hypothetical protein
MEKRNDFGQEHRGCAITSEIAWISDQKIILGREIEILLGNQSDGR